MTTRRSEEFDLPTIDEGVENFTHVVSPIEAGATCNVVETTVLPDGSTTTYDPAGADTEGVEVIGGDQVAVTVTNNFEGVELLPTDVVATPTPAAAVAAAPAFTG